MVAGPGPCVIDVFPRGEDEPPVRRPLPGGVIPWCRACGAMTPPRVPCTRRDCDHRILGGSTDTTSGAGWPD